MHLSTDSVHLSRNLYRYLPHTHIGGSMSVRYRIWARAPINALKEGVMRADSGAVALWLATRRDALGLPAESDPDEALDHRFGNASASGMDTVEVRHHFADRVVTD